MSAAESGPRPSAAFLKELIVAQARQVVACFGNPAAMALAYSQLATSVALLDAAEAGALPAPVTAPTIPGLIEGPRQLFASNSFCEKWAQGPEAARRVRQLRKALGGRGISTRGYQHIRKENSEPGAHRTAMAAVEIRYDLPAGTTVPALVAERHPKSLRRGAA